MKYSEENKVTDTAKEAYLKPAMEVYEMEMDTAILSGTNSYLPGSEAKANDVMNPLAGLIDELKA